MKKTHGVSIPFIAGQWSLRGADRGLRRGGPRFNPLHCGAVVASPEHCVSGDWTWNGFNPLHCGAVVASIDARDRPVADAQVSIPFIAGQWSLQEANRGTVS